MKKDVKKFVAFVSMLALIPTVSVCTGTVSRHGYVRNVNNYGDSYSGSVGSYAAGGNSSYASTSAQNTSKTDKYYFVATYKQKYDTKAYVLKSTKNTVLTAGSSENTQIKRDKTTGDYDYIHTAIGYASNSLTSYKVDSYSYEAWQYYR